MYILSEPAALGVLRLYDVFFRSAVAMFMLDKGMEKSWSSTIHMHHTIDRSSCLKTVVNLVFNVSALSKSF